MRAPSPLSFGWVALGVALIAYCGLLHFISPLFGYDVDVASMPVGGLVGLGLTAGLVYLFIPLLLARTAQSCPADRRTLLIWILFAGLAMRLVFVGSTPILEDDYQRYLWDGAVTAHGLSPYAHAPLAAAADMTGSAEVADLAEDAGLVLHRINYPHLRTVYPVVAQIAFALAYWIDPWSLDAWRTVLLIGDAAVAGFVLLLLRSIGRSPLWIALYWWNPLVAKELHNSAHMDVLVILAVVAATWLAIRHRYLASALVAALGFGVKLWPLVLLPSLLRRRAHQPAALIVPVIGAALLSAAFVVPLLIAQFDSTSGFVAYGGTWQANDLAFRVIEWPFIAISEGLGFDTTVGELLARGTVAMTVLIVVVLINRQAPADAIQLCWRVFVTIAVLFLLSPTQFPWYFCWIAPFLPLFPVRGFLFLTLTLPLYYLYFYLAARDLEQWFHYGVVLLIWLPAWALLLLDARRGSGFWLSTEQPAPTASERRS